MKHAFWKGFTKQGGIQEVACVGVVDGDKILMGKRRDNGKWTNPGGHMNPGEKPLDGAVRELFEETGIKADPKNLEHLSSKLVTKPGGKQLKIHAFKLDEGKHKTTMSGDPDQEVFRWTWQHLPLKEDVSLNLHVPEKNILLDAMGIRYGKAKIMNGDHYAELQKKMAAAGDAGNPTGFMRALHEHFHHLDMVVPDALPQQEEPNGNEKEEPKKDHQAPPPEDPNAGAPMAKMATPVHRRLVRMAIRKSPRHEAERLTAELSKGFAEHIRHAGGKTNRDEHGDCV